MARKLTRKEMREQLYRMLFQLEFHKDAELDEQLALFMDDLQEISWSGCSCRGAGLHDQ